MKQISLRFLGNMQPAKKQVRLAKLTPELELYFSTLTGNETSWITIRGLTNNILSGIMFLLLQDIVLYPLWFI